MLPFAESFLAIVVALVVPTFVGLMLISGAARRVSPRYLAAFTLGIYLWFFSDTVGDSSYLGVNSGLSGGAAHGALVVLFAAGLLLVFSVDGGAFKAGPEGDGLGFGIPLLVAFAVGMHGFGEGAAFSATAAATASTNLLAAFGGPYPAASFVVHKALEPMMIGAAYWVYAGGHAKDGLGVTRDMLLLTLVFALPGIVGGGTNYFVGYDTTYFFAFGLGTSLYAAARLAKPLFGAGPSRSDSFRVALAILFGFICIYVAALFHSVSVL